MSGKEMISSRQFMCIVMLFCIGSAILIVPATVASYAKQDAWIATIIGGAATLGIIWLYMAVGSINPTMTLIELNDKLLGKPFGKLVSLLLFFLTFIGGPVPLLYQVGNFITTQIMPETPIQAILITFALILIMGVRLGLETLAKSSEILLLWFMFLFVTLVLFVSPEMKIEQIQPVLEAGIKPTLPAALYFVAITALPMIVLLTIFPSHVNNFRKARKAFFIGNLFGVIVLVIVISLCILVLGADLTTRNLYPSYALAKKVSVGRFLQRIEAIMAFMWFISLFFKLALYFYTTSICVAKVFGLKDYRPLVISLGGIMITLSLIQFPTTIYLNTNNIEFWVPFITIAGFLYPLLLLVIARFQERRNSHR